MSVVAQRPGLRYRELRELLSEPLINGRSVVTRDGGFPVLRLTAIKSSGIDMSERKGGDWEVARAKPFIVAEGDFLVSRGSGSLALVGRGAIVPASPIAVAFPDTMIRVRIQSESLSAAYLSWIWDSPIVREQITKSVRTTSGIYKLNQESLGKIVIPVPSLSEQHRITQVLEKLSVLRLRRRRAISLFDDLALSVFLRMFGDPIKNDRGWRQARVADAGVVQLGRQRAPKHQTGDHTHPYMRVANVYEDRIDLSDVLSMDFNDTDFVKYKLQTNDILLNEGQSTELVGRPAVWRDEIPDCCFQNTLIRFQVTRGLVDPLYAFAVFRRYFRTGEFAKISSKTSSVAHLGAARFAELPFPMPPLGLQGEFSTFMQSLSGVKARQQHHLERVEILFESVQRRAFRGELWDSDFVA